MSREVGPEHTLLGTSHTIWDPINLGPTRLERKGQAMALEQRRSMDSKTVTRERRKRRHR